jgi:hypothetical protein
VESMMRATRRPLAEGESSPANIGRAKRRGEQAIQAFYEANALDAMTRLSRGDEVVYSAEAKRARKPARRFPGITSPMRPSRVPTG